MTAASRQQSFWSAFAESARGLLGKEERRLGGISKTRITEAPAAELAAPLSTFKMLGLADIQDRLADRWPALSEKVHSVAQSKISKHLARGDVFERFGDDGYLVLFASLSPEEAEFKSRIIAKEIAEHLLGEGGAGEIQLSTLCTTISVEALARGDQDAALNEALTRATPPREFNPARITALARTEVAGDRPPPSPVRSASTQTYSPVWDVTKMTLLRFRATMPDAAPPDPESEAAATRNDVGRIRAVIHDLRRLVESGRRLPVVIPIQHASLNSGSQREKIQNAISETPDALRKLITMEICFPQDEFWTYGCKIFLEAVRPLNMGWCALIALDRSSLIPSSRMQLGGVGSVIAGDGHSEPASLRLMTDFGQRARHQGLECAAYGLTSRALVLGAVGAGFQFLSGPVIHKDVLGIANAMRFEPLDLYRDLIDSAPNPKPPG